MINNLINFELIHVSLFVLTALTKQEIRTVEGKLIKHFSKQLATKAGLTPEQMTLVQDEVNQYPSLDLWLSVVGTSPQSAKCIQSKVKYRGAR